MNSPRFDHTSVVISQQILFIIGGRLAENEKKILDSIEKLDFSNQKPMWEEINFTSPDEFWTSRDTLGSFTVDNKEIVIFGGHHGWQSETFIYNIIKGEIKKSDQYLKKAEEFMCGHPVEYKEKVYIVGGCDKDIHIYSKRKWYMLEKELLDW